MRKRLKFVFAAYLALWGITWLVQPSQLLEHIRQSDEWGANGKRIHVMVPAPFVVRLDWAWGEGNQGMHGREGWFIWTPFRSFTLSSRDTWIS